MRSELRNEVALSVMGEVGEVNERISVLMMVAQCELALQRKSYWN
ncbi:MAG: hypothetical protein OJF50_002149 [Nitrospira sp.]|nr:hypothetical protein [Nitrospira sp.]